MEQIIPIHLQNMLRLYCDTLIDYYQKKTKLFVKNKQPNRISYHCTLPNIKLATSTIIINNKYYHTIIQTHLQFISYYYDALCYDYLNMNMCFLKTDRHYQLYYRFLSTYSKINQLYTFVHLVNYFNDIKTPTTLNTMNIGMNTFICLIKNPHLLIDDNCIKCVHLLLDKLDVMYWNCSRMIYNIDHIIIVLKNIFYTNHQQLKELITTHILQKIDNLYEMIQLHYFICTIPPIPNWDQQLFFILFIYIELVSFREIIPELIFPYEKKCIQLFEQYYFYDILYQFIQNSTLTSTNEPLQSIIETYFLKPYFLKKMLTTINTATTTKNENYLLFL